MDSTSVDHPEYPQNQLEAFPFWSFPDEDSEGSVSFSPAKSPEPTVIPRTPPSNTRLERPLSGARTSASRRLTDTFMAKSPSLQRSAATPMPRQAAAHGKPRNTPSESPNSTFLPMRNDRDGASQRSPAVLTPKTTDTSQGTKQELMLRSVLKQVQESNAKLQEKFEQLEQKIDDMQEENSTKPRLKKKKLSPPPEVREAIRKVYHTLVEETDGFEWDTSSGISSPANMKILVKLVQEVKSHFPDTPSAIIKEAARTYFSSLVSTERLKQSGKYTTKCLKQRRRNRIMRKLNRRKAAIAKTTSLTEAQKTDVLECLVPEVMSSEESDPDTSNSQFITRPLPWRSDKVNRLFQGLDRKSMKHKSRRSKLMEFERIVGIPSDRPQPPFLSEWICKS